VSTSGPAPDGPRVFDGVTLRHFGAIEQLSILEARVVHYPLPRWTEGVRSEVLAGIGRPECDAVLAASFLGAPYELDAADLDPVFRLQVGLRGGPIDGHRGRDLGEAESIQVADRFNGAFITDDAAAYDFARRRLGSNRVFDTVDLLREAVGGGEMGPSDAQHVADAIRNTGRYLRKVHPITWAAAYFEP
jgi:hypothetical protein